MGTDERWVLAYEYEPGRTSGPTGIRLPVGHSLLAGREGDLPVGVAIPDPSVSRKAVEVTATEAGWDVNITNTNGAVLHAWGQAPLLISGRHRLVWPRIALHILNGARAGAPALRHHWLLFEADMISVTPVGPQAGTNSPSRTFSPKPPPPLSPGQRDALGVVFGELLRWPPQLPADPVKLRTAARVLGISESAVQERLQKAREKALQVGLHRACGLTDPEYLYVLVRAGFLPPPRNRIDRTEQPWAGIDTPRPIT